MILVIGIATILMQILSIVIIFLRIQSQITIKMCNFAVIKARILNFYGT